MRLGMRAAILAAAIGLAGLAPAKAQVTEAMFRGGKTSDLAALCGASAQDPNRTTALAYCHGFMIGAGQYHNAVAKDRGTPRRLFCLPAPEPTLEDVRAAFVTWAAANPGHAQEKAVDGLMRFAAGTYPCPAGVTQARSRR